jgi:hypothetical protein
LAPPGVMKKHRVELARKLKCGLGFNIIILV